MLPIHSIRGEIAQAVAESNRIVIGAPTGSGKSTQVPQFLLENREISGRILVLEPRRLAARMLARRVAAERSERVGETIGFQTRFESAQTRETRVLFVTEGILPRMIQGDPRLRGIDAVVLDEFHERSLDADLSLGLVMQLQQDRPDLRLVVMSATLETEALAGHLQPCLILEAEGRLHPVTMGYAKPAAAKPLWERAVVALRQLIGSGEPGDVLVFMPGVYEIRKTVEAVKKAKLGEPVTCLALYGDLSVEQQDEALAPSPRRKVIVATNIAETSLTISGVRHVIDSGVARVNRYDPGRGLNGLQLEPISRASATQRAGRAGREGPGRCMRLYTQREFESRPASTEAEILRLDLSELLLFLRTRGIEPATFPWLTPPKAHALEEATSLLLALEAIDAEGVPTVAGRTMSKLPMAPRLARLVYEARDRECLETAVEIAALLSERSILAGGSKGAAAFFRQAANCNQKGGPQSDWIALLAGLHAARQARFHREACQQLGVNGAACRQVFRLVEQFQRRCARLGWHVGDDAGWEEVAKCLVCAFPDRLAAKPDVNSSTCHLGGERRADLAKASTVRRTPILVAAEYRQVSRPGAPARSELSLVSEVREAWLRELDPQAFRVTEQMHWLRGQQLIECRRETRWRGLVIARAPSQAFNYEQAAAMLAEMLVRDELQLRGWTKHCTAWIERVRWLVERVPTCDLPTYDDDDMRVIYAEFAEGARRYAEIRDKDVLPYLRNALSWDEQQYVEKMAPAELPLPSGRKLRVSYKRGREPTGRARIQELYGLDTTPCVAGGRVPLQLEILGPNMRPVQTTCDLTAFWSTLYPEIKPALARRYPKHEWR